MTPEQKEQFKDCPICGDEGETKCTPQANCLTVPFEKTECPSHFIYEGITHECIGNDDNQFWTVIDGETKGFEQSNCEAITDASKI